MTCCLRLREVARRRRIIVLVDELDRGWDSSEDARAFVAGLFQACISVNTVHDNLRVYMSLRRELYEDIPALYEDAQKYRDLIEAISWDSASLGKLMANRIRHSLPALADHDDRACWDTLFAAFPGGGSFRYMIDRTLYRPREIIQFCTLAVECARDSRTTVPLRHYRGQRCRAPLLPGTRQGHRRRVPLPVSGSDQRLRGVPGKGPGIQPR